MNKPNFFIVGAAKSGTTSLYNYLSSHPDVYFSPIKEPNYFNTELKFDNCREDIKKKINLDFDKYFDKSLLAKRHSACIDNLADYLQLFRDVKDEKLIGEASTSYLYSKNAPQEIYNFNRKSKIIIILREPVSRTISHYFMDVVSGNATGAILNELKKDYESKNKGYFVSNLYIDLSLYYEQVKRYITVFPKNQILFLKFEDLKKEPQAIMKKALNFLDLTESKTEINKMKVYNITSLPKNIVIKWLLKFKKYIPNGIIKNSRIKSFFLKPYNQQETPEDAKEFIAQMTSDNYIETKKLIKKTYCKSN